ncbi:hypothetical protein BST61_g8495 [Cercospora zeina]
MPLLMRRPSVLGVPGSSNSSTDNIAVHPQARHDALAPPTASLKPGVVHPRPVTVGVDAAPLPTSRLSREPLPDDIAGPSADHDAATRSRKRFSLMKFRNYSESHLSARAKLDAEREQPDDKLPPVPAVPQEAVVPTIVKTAPTMGHNGPQVQQADTERQARPSLFRRPSALKPRASDQLSRDSSERSRTATKGRSIWRRGKTSGLEDLHRLSAAHLSDQHSAPPSYREHSNSALAVPVSQLTDPRFSESSRSDGSSGDGHIYGSTTTTTHTVQTHTTFFKLPRRNKNRNSLFPLPVKLPPPDDAKHDQNDPVTPRASTQSLALEQPDATPSLDVPADRPLRRAHTESNPPKRAQASPSQGSPKKGSLAFAEPDSSFFRQSSPQSHSSNPASPLQPPMRLGLRDRSSTRSSFGGRSAHDAETPPLSASGRTSTSTAGRSSLGGLLNLSRFRQSAEPYSPGTRSKSNSFAMSREALVIPEREEGDTPGKYLERLENAVSRSVIAGILSKSSDPFAQAVLRSYTRRFPFFTEPIDMSLRKFLLEAELPKETQQVDRVIQAFADRYHECNPGIYASADSAYFIAFSIMMLHTDAFNRNNKRKMQRQDYVKNTSGQGISDDVLACFYDNICYTPFIHYDEDVDIDGDRVLHFTQPKKSGGKLKSAIPGASDVSRKPSGPVDPYNLIVEQKLDALRPTIKDTILMDDPYDYRGSQGDLDPHYLQRAFTHTGIIQIISARSRPAAYESQFVNGQSNTMDTQQGIVDLKITKVGLLWRKSAKKKKTRSPWQEWGAILTGSQLYLFRNAHWAKGLMHQFINQQRPGRSRTPVVFKPPLQDFKPDALIKTDNAVALVDSTYTRHKNAFTFVRHGGQEEVFLADNESELYDWLGLINYAAAFRAAGVRIRGMTGGNEDSTQSIKRLGSTNSSRSIQTDDEEVTVTHRGIGPQLQQQVMAARRQIMAQKIAEIEGEIESANRQLENMLRNARHLLILAPIAPRTREDVVLAAGRADAMIRWLRRDMWRMKCHRDILAMDVRIDGMSAAELEKLKPSETDSVRKDKPKMLTRFSSHRATKSPPQSPASLTFNRPPTRGSGDELGADQSATPPQSTIPQKYIPYRLPPLELNAPQETEHPSSASSLLLSASPPTDRGSLQHSHSASSILQTRTHSTDTSGTGNGGALTPAASVDERELQLLARATMTPDAHAMRDGGPSIDGPAPGTSPESSKHKGVRRSLQKTLRDHHHTPSLSHRHRRNKESDSTVRSAHAEGQDSEEATPRLTRDKPRFVLHGKQASVVQFGGDWERMKLRREQYEASRPSTEVQTQMDAAFVRKRSEAQEQLRAGMFSPVVQYLNRGGTTDEDDDSASIVSARSSRSDADAAATFAAAESQAKSSATGDTTDFPAFVDLSHWDPDTGRRTTVLSPMSPTSPEHNQLRHRRFSSLQKGRDGMIEDVEDAIQNGYISTSGSQYSTSPPCFDREADTPPFDFASRENRRTVIGPSTLSQEFGKAEASQSHLSPSPANEESNHSAGSSFVEGENGFVRAIGDEELRSMSSSLNASPQTIKSR